MYTAKNNGKNNVQYEVLERGNGPRWQKLNGLFVAYLSSGFIKNHIIEGSQE